MKVITVLLILMLNVTAYGQWVGTYEGELNGDKIIVNITSQANKKIVGEMVDSYQKFKITGDINGNRMAGDAVEQTLGLKFTLLGELKGNIIDFKLIMNILGLTSETPFSVTRKSKATDSKTVSSATNVANSTNNTSRDSKVAGRWTKNESYNSGYGDNFMGANFSQSIIFFADGGVADGGSSATMSGSNYSGKSKDGGSNQAVPGLVWHTKDNQIFLTFTQDGKSQTESLGKYYIENNKMLITLANGNKVLLTR
jgi:hypothetical protein